MSRPVLLDLFCKAGGASMGYHRAGFEVVGVDIEPQRHYPFQFIQADALEYLAECGHCYDAIAASPPCQSDTILASLHRSKGTAYDEKHKSLTAPVRDLLIASGKPYVIEGVVGAPLIEPILLCGSMFGLQTKCGAQLRRHRLFETNWFCMAPPRCVHTKGTRSIDPYGTGQAMEGARTIGVYGGHGRDRGLEQRTICVSGKTPWSGPLEGRTIGVHGRPQLIEPRSREEVITITGHSAQQNVVKNKVRVTYTVEQAREAMGIDWMTQAELSQAIPPVYTHLIGLQLMEAIR